MKITSESVRSIERQEAGVKEKEQPPVVLTQRDRELFVHLAIARYLSLEQIARLVFPGKTDSIAPRRLRRLASGKHQYVRRLPFRMKAGGMALAWSLKPLGFMAAQNHFPAAPDQPTHDPPGAEFLEHDVWLNELYVALAVAARRKKLSFERWPFRWFPSDSARLPWTEFDSTASSPASRLICPDATIELLHVKRRVFVELETGTHTLGFRREGILGRNATKLKIDRYTRFVVTPVSTQLNQTFYLQAFPDGWRAELLFVVPSEVRRNAIREYLATSWRPANEAVPFAIRALTLEEAPADLCRAAQLASEAATPQANAPGATLSPEEVRAFYDFYNAAIAAIAAMRQALRSNPGVAAAIAVPEYPPNHQAVKQICGRIAGVTR